MKTKIGDNFYLRSSIFTILSLVSAVAGYVLYPILVRLMPSATFGDFAVSIATLNQILAVLLTVNVISIYLVKKYPEDEARVHAQTIQKVLIWVFVCLIIGVIALSPFLKSLFKIDDISLFIPVALTLLASIPLVVWTGYLQGHKELVRIGVFSLGSAVAKLVLAIPFALVAGAIGALFGVFAGTLIGLVILAIYPGVKLPLITSAFSKVSRKEVAFVASMKLYIVEAAFVVGVLGVLQNYDISLAKTLFDPAAAGIYSGISILSNALYYLAFILVWIVLPEINIREPRVNRRVLRTAYLALGALLVVAIVGELVLRDYLLPVLLGEQFSGKADLLLFATLYQVTLVAIALYAFFLLVCRKNRSVILVGLLLAGCLLIAPHFATTPLRMVQALWLSSVSAVATYAVLTSLYRFMKRGSPEKNG